MFSSTRTPFITLAACLGVLLAACAHNEGAGTTTVTSGSTSGVRVTNTRENDDAAMRLADEVCARELACNHIGDGARYRSEEACLADQGAQAPVQLSRWSCTPTQTQAGFEECLAAIRSEKCETALPRVDRLTACRSAAVCGR
ncbi:MAG: hypothetical protein JWP87_974 [Labilithrix sp.]|nr:hypothetical protein [Labilithrix sp.]